MRYPGLSIVIALLACGLASCSAAKEPPSGQAAADKQQNFRIDDRDTKKGEELQAKLMADRSVSRSDYEQAVKAVGECFSRYNLTFSNEGWDPVANRTIDFTFGNEKLSDDEVLGYGDGCQRAYLEKIQEAFVTSSKPVMNPAVLKESQACLKQHGIQPTMTETNVHDLLASGGKPAFKTVVKCIQESAHKIYPSRSIHVSG
ncbi:hypothetical protein [Actinoplanes sp. NPDC049118]|uniref:hypothetical protein n=1 Tax=Actinoplanes sp. NPDC049118 TaxID=3155769 RepID=UPI0033C6E785